MKRVNKTVRSRATSPVSDSLVVAGGPCAHDGCVLYLVGAFREPLNGVVRHRVEDLFQRGERTIVLDLARVWSIDAAGVGQLLGLYHQLMAADGVLRIVRARSRVREVLQRAGVFNLLTDGRD